MPPYTPLQRLTLAHLNVLRTDWNYAQAHYRVHMEYRVELLHELHLAQARYIRALATYYKKTQPIELARTARARALYILARQNYRLDPDPHTRKRFTEAWQNWRRAKNMEEDELDKQRAPKPKTHVCKPKRVRTITGRTKTIACQHTTE